MWFILGWVLSAYLTALIYDYKHSHRRKNIKKEDTELE